MEQQQLTTEYATGSVQPPKNYRQPVSLILLGVLFCGCLVCALSFWGIRLSVMYNKDSATTVRFIDDMRLSPVTDGENYTNIDSLGIRGRFITEFEQRYFDLPQGVYINSHSQSIPGLCVGDVLLAINGEEITNQDMLDAIVESHAHGAALTLEVYRGGHYQIFSAFLVKNPEV